MKKFNGALASIRTDAHDRVLTMVAALLILLAITTVAFSQITTATIVGTVTDPGGAQVPAASVTARNTDTGLKRTVTSDEDGNYRMEFLPVGNYVVEVTAASGFKSAVPRGHCFASQ